MPRVLVSGSIAFDLLLSYDGSFVDSVDPAALNDLSLAFVTPHFARHHGGTAANIAWHMKLMKQHPLVVSSVGNDGWGYLSLLDERQIATDYIECIHDAMTATAILATDNHERHIIFFHPGADARGNWPDLNAERDELAYAIIAPRDVTLMMNALHWCSEQKVPAIFDPGQQVMAFGDDELKRAVGLATGIIANTYEWNVLTERLKVTEADLLKQLDLVVITKGEEGVSVHSRSEAIDIPACQAEQVINPTGAGDALRAGLMTGLAQGWSLRDAGRLGAALGSFAVEIEGTLPDRLETEDVWQRAALAYGEELPKL